jgi:long-chain acyl-CoA synthetase
VSEKTVPGLLLERVSATPAAVALRYYRRGKWNDETFAQLQASAAAIGTGLLAAGIKPGNVVAVISANKQRAIAVEIGAQGVGMTVLAIDPDETPEATRLALQSSRAVCLVAGDQEQFDKVFDEWDAVPLIRLLVVDELRGLRHLESNNRTDGDRTMTFAQLEAKADSGWESAARSLDGSAPARVVVSHGSVRFVSHAQAVAAAERFLSSTTLTRNDVLYSLRSVADLTEFALVVAGPLLTGAVLNFGGSELVEQGLRQVQPTMLHASPAWVGRVAADLALQASQARGLKKWALAKGVSAVAPATTMRTRAQTMPTRVVGISVSLLVFLFFFVSVNINDVLRLVIAVSIAAVAALLLVATGEAVRGPLRRRFGLTNCRGVIVPADHLYAGSEVLGALGIPVVPFALEVQS